MAFLSKKKSKTPDPIEATPDDPFGASPQPMPSQQQQQPTPQPVTPKVNVPPDVYTALLGAAALAMGIAALLLFLNIYLQGSDPTAGIPRV